MQFNTQWLAQGFKLLTATMVLTYDMKGDLPANQTEVFSVAMEEILLRIGLPR